VERTEITRREFLKHLFSASAYPLLQSFIPEQIVDTPSYVLQTEQRIVKLPYEEIVAWDKTGHVLFDLKGGGWQVSIPPEAYFGKQIDIITHNYPRGQENWEEMFFGDYHGVNILNPRVFRIVHKWPKFVMHQVIRTGTFWPNIPEDDFYKFRGNTRNTWLHMASKYGFVYE